MKIDLIEPIELSQSIVGRLIDAFGNSLVAGSGPGVFSAVFVMGLKGVDHWSRKEYPTAACRQ